MSTQFDLEQQIMQCWNIIEDIRVVYIRHLDGDKPLTDDEFANIMIGLEKLYDIKIVYTTHLDGDKPLTEDELANIFIGMEYLYNIKFNNLFSTFEKFLKEIHESKVRDNSEVLRQTESFTVSGY